MQQQILPSRQAAIDSAVEAVKALNQQLEEIDKQRKSIKADKTATMAYLKKMLGKQRLKELRPGEFTERQPQDARAAA